MIFLRLMIEKTFPYSDQVLNYSSISNKLFDVMAVSLSYFPLLDIDLFFFLIFLLLLRSTSSFLHQTKIKRTRAITSREMAKKLQGSTV